MMLSLSPHAVRRSLLGLLAPAVALGLGAGPAAATGPDDAVHHGSRLAVRGDAKVIDGACGARGCAVTFAAGRFRGTPGGPGAYTGSRVVRVAEAFPNGDGGICAPFTGSVSLGAGSRDRLDLVLAGDSCQDGADDAFTGLARFVIKGGSGRHAHTAGGGLATFTDEGRRNHLTLIGHLAR
jgi:hypothetical protein